MAREVRKQRTRWRDHKLPRLHARFGCAYSSAVFRDLFLEYDEAKPAALVEYRPKGAMPLSVSHPAVQAARELAERNGVGFFVARYTDDFSFEVAPVGDRAGKWLNGPTEFREDNFVRWLYELRGRRCPAKVLGELILKPYPDTMGLRHREYGWNAPAVDLDLVTCRVDDGLPAAVIEYKRDTAKRVNMRHPTTLACKALGEGARVPFFVVRYAGDYSRWQVRASGDLAREILGAKVEVLSQAEYFSLLRRLSGAADIPLDAFEAFV